MKKVNDARSKPQRKTGIESGTGILDAEGYQFIRSLQVKQSPIMDLDAIQRARFEVKQHVCEDVVIA